MIRVRKSEQKEKDKIKREATERNQEKKMQAKEEKSTKTAKEENSTKTREKDKEEQRREMKGEARKGGKEPDQDGQNGKIT